MSTDLVLGAFDWYNYDQLKPWVRSLKATGFSGDIVLVCFNASFDTVDALVADGVKIIACEIDQKQRMYLHKSNIPIHVERFWHFFHILKDHAYKYRYVLATDVKDIIFQHNPFDFIYKMCSTPNTKLIATSEAIKYKDEPWGNQNIEQCFGPYFHDYFKHNTIYNVGVIAGDSLYARDLFLNIFLMSTNRPIPIVDQAVFNALMYTHPYNNVTYKADMQDAFAVHLGTTMDPSKIETFRPLLIEPEPHLCKANDGSISIDNEDWQSFAIVHQWDRVPELKEYYERKYA